MVETTTVKPDPVHDPERLQEIFDLDLTQPFADHELREMLAQVAVDLDVETVLLTAVLDTAQHFTASYGLEGWLAEIRGTPIDWSFCIHAIRQDDVFVVPDAHEHPELSSNHLVRHDGLRCYAGAPVRTRNGHVIGTLCVIGSEQRSFSTAHIEKLQAWALQASDHLELRRG